MRIERAFTTAGRSPYEAIGFRTACSEIRNPDGSVRLQARRHRGAERLVPGRGRRPGAEVFSQGRRAEPPRPDRGQGRARMAAAAAGRWQGAGQAARGPALRQRDLSEAGVRPAGRHLDVLGLEGRLLRFGGGRARLLRRAALHDGEPARRAELTAVVQHRPALGLRHRRAGPGPLFRRPQDRRGAGLQLGLRAARSRMRASSRA